MKSPILEKIELEYQKIEATKKRLCFVLQNEFPSLLKDIFEKAEFLESVGWIQYTPYFNDGDECVFSIHGSLFINGYSDDFGDLDDFKPTPSWLEKDYRLDAHPYLNPNFNPEHHRIVKEVDTIIWSIPKDLLKEIFGDGVKVTINKNSTIDVEEWEHD